VLLLAGLVLVLTACGSTADTAASQRSAGPAPLRKHRVSDEPALLVHVDASRDVRAIVGDQYDDEARPARHLRSIDILSTRVGLSNRELRVRLSYSDLPEDSEDTFGSAFRASLVIKTDRGLGREFTYDWRKRGEGKRYAFRLHPYGEPAECDFDANADRARDVVDLSVPRRCLGPLHWIRVQVSSVVWVGDHRETVAWDDGFDDEAKPSSHPHWSPRVHAVS
jgi:hypothetical protein